MPDALRRPRIKPGDLVRHVPSGDVWHVAAVRDDDVVYRDADLRHLPDGAYVLVSAVDLEVVAAASETFERAMVLYWSSIANLSDERAILSRAYAVARGWRPIERTDVELAPTSFLVRAGTRELGYVTRISPASWRWALLPTDRAFRLPEATCEDAVAALLVAVNAKRRDEPMPKGCGKCCS